MSASDNEAVAGSAAGDSLALSNTVSASLDVNPFVGEGGAYNSVRPAYPDEAVAALVDAARRARGAHATVLSMSSAIGRPAPSRGSELIRSSWRALSSAAGRCSVRF